MSRIRDRFGRFADRGQRVADRGRRAAGRGRRVAGHGRRIAERGGGEIAAKGRRIGEHRAVSAGQRVAVRIAGNRFALAAMVLLALPALYGAAAFTRPDQPSPGKGRDIPLVASVAACPVPQGNRVSVLAGAVQSQEDGGQGRVEVKETRWGRGGPAAAVLTTPGVLWYSDVKQAKGSWVVRARGPLARGLGAEQVSTSGLLAGTRCASPGTDHWFLGPGPAAVSDVELHVANVDDRSAVIDVQALSADGPLDTPEGRGTTIDPHTTRVIRIGKQQEGLGEIVKSAGLTALRVRANTGRVVAAVRLNSSKGSEWLPQAGRPGTDLVVPGLPSGTGDRDLLIAVPGETDANVKVTAMTPDGTFAPEGQGQILVPGRTLSSLTLSRALSGKPGALRIVADRPVVAGYVARVRPDGGREDIASGAAVPALTGTAIVAANRSSAGVESRLLLTAPGRDATVRVSAVAGHGQAGAAQEVTVRGGRTSEVRLTPAQGAEGGYAVLITPKAGSGPVHAARVLTGKEHGITALPVITAPATAGAPPINDSLTSLWP